MAIADANGTTPKWALGWINSILAGAIVVLIGVVWTSLQAEISAHSQQIEKVESRVSGHDTKFENHTVRLDNKDKQLDRIEQKLDQLFDEIRRVK